MTTVLVASSADESLFSKTIGTALKENFSTILVSRTSLIVPDTPGELLVCSSSISSEIQCGKVIALYRDGCCIDAKMQQGVAVVDSGSAQALANAGASGVPAITCGLSPRDSITLSSVGVDDAVINLQRSVTTFYGTEIEPQEFPVKLTRAIDNFALMALACIFILTENSSRLTQAKL